MSEAVVAVDEDSGNIIQLNIIWLKRGKSDESVQCQRFL